jgi:hypothetical protein
MEIIGTVPPRAIDANDDGSVDMRRMRRLGLHKQYKRMAVGHKDKTTDDYPIYLFGEGTMLLNSDEQRGGSVILDRQEVCQLYTFFDQPHVERMMLGILRANLVEAGHGELIDQLMSMPNDHKQAILWAFGRAEKPAFLDAQPAA